jgi:predicted peroxiredoxin
LRGNISKEEEGWRKYSFNVWRIRKTRRASCFPFMLAVACKERRDEVEIGLGGDGVVLIRDEVINAAVPMGWPPLRETFQKVVELGIPIRVRGGCSQARGVTQKDLEGKKPRFSKFEETAERYATWDKALAF